MILEKKPTQLINATHNILLHIVIVVRQRDGVGAMGAVSPLSLNKVFILKKNKPNMRETSTKSVNNAIKICIWGKGLESVPPSLSRVLKPSWILSTSYSPTYKTIYSKHFCEP